MKSTSVCFSFMYWAAVSRNAYTETNVIKPDILAIADVKRSYECI